MKIDCTQCTMYRSDRCGDCMVTSLMTPSAEGVEIDDDLAEPLHALSEAGLIPVLRFRPHGEQTRETRARAG